VVEAVRYVVADVNHNIVCYPWNECNSR
jgi:hypothetical protein